MIAAPPAVTPEALLAARDQRVARRRALQAERPGSTVVGVTLVVPGPVKSSPTLEAVRDEAVGAVIRVCLEHGWTVDEHRSQDDATGPDALLAVQAPGAPLKGALVRLEGEHPVGRLWDLDVFDGDRPLSRTALGHGPRLCLLCDSPAHACARAQTHALADLLAAVEVLRARLER